MCIGTSALTDTALVDVDNTPAVAEDDWGEIDDILGDFDFEV